MAVGAERMNSSALLAAAAKGTVSRQHVYSVAMAWKLLSLLKATMQQVLTVTATMHYEILLLEETMQQLRWMNW